MAATGNKTQGSEHPVLAAGDVDERCLARRCAHGCNFLSYRDKRRDKRLPVPFAFGHRVKLLPPK